LQLFAGGHGVPSGGDNSKVRGRQAPRITLARKSVVRAA